MSLNDRPTARVVLIVRKINPLILQDVPDGRYPTVDWYTISCRQMAYDHAMFDLVMLIDQLNGDLWPFINLPEREIRTKKTPEEKQLEREQKEEELRREEEERRRQEEELLRAEQGSQDGSAGK